MSKKLIWKVLLILGVIALSFWYAFPLDKRISLGLDLQGGMHLLMRVDTSNLSSEAKKDAVERALEVIRNRIDEFGVKEPLIQRQGEDEIVVQLPGITDRKRAIDLIGKTALLEFKLVSSDPEALKLALSGTIPDGYELKYVENEPLLVEKTVSLTGDALITAEVRFDQGNFGQSIVALEFNTLGAKKFAEVTAANVGRRLAIVLDGKVQSAPRINEAIPSGQAVITGRFSPEEAQDLAIVLRVGALPAPMYVEEERTVGPLLGQDSIKTGIKATIIGSCLVFGFMILYYLLAGFVADIALILNFLMILAGMGMFHATLTLPGIAGIVLTLGMAVDANVLINERIREELKLGKPLRNAISAGYAKAFSAIFDSNLTTLIAAFILFQFGTGPIRGFAVTLTIGLVASMFTAIVVTRVIFELLLMNKSFKNLPMLQLIKETKIDFIGKRRICYALSILVIIAGIIGFFVKGKAVYGIDFSGGQLQEYEFTKSIPIGDIRAGLSELGLNEASIQQVKENSKVVIIRTSSDTADVVQKSFEQKFPNNKFQVLRIEKVGPVAGSHLRSKAKWAIFWALISILVYVAFRFKHINFAIAGVLAIFHDILVAAGILVLAGRQIDLLIVTALLTIAGYSINDTIVIYDRVRENTRLMRKLSLKELINLSVNQTLGRTILTSGVTLLAVASIFLFGGEVLNNFSFCLLVGFISGVYSTVYIASPLVLAWQKNR
ncbi:MAG: protein translocase subunit SecD [Candidatus Omnitrophota bacterium]